MNVEVSVKKVSRFRPIGLHFKEKEDYDMLMEILLFVRTNSLPGSLSAGTWAKELCGEILDVCAKTEDMV